MATEKKFVSTSAGVKLFDYGVSAAKIAREIKADGVEGLYWYAIDLGSYGLAKGVMSSASNAGAGMDALKQVNTLQPDFQWYGGSRILGKYYQELLVYLVAAIKSFRIINYCYNQSTKL